MYFAQYKYWIIIIIIIIIIIGISGHIVYVTFLVDLFEIYIFITWYSLFEHMFCLELGKVCKTNT